MSLATPNRRRDAALGLGVVCALLAVATPLAAATLQVEVSASAAGLAWQPATAYRGATLIVAGPHGRVATRRFGPGEPIAFALIGDDGQALADGRYRWELRLARELPAATVEALTEAEEKGDDRRFREIVRQVGGTTERASGRFRLAGGLIWQPVAPAAASTAPSSAAPVGDIEISDADPKLTFTDTDHNDFYIEANNDELSFYDKDAATRVMGIEAGASADAILISSGASSDAIFVTAGSVGLFTTMPGSPDVELHVASDADEIPEIRLEDTGLTPQVWDLRSGFAGTFQLVDQTTAFGDEVALEIEKTPAFPVPLYELIFNGSATINGDVAMGSSRELKTGLTPAAGAELLERLRRLPLFTWSYKSDPETRHLGPMAEEFHGLFGLGRDDRHLSPGDSAGLALATVQALHAVIEEKDTEIRALVERLDRLEGEMERLSAAAAPATGSTTTPKGDGNGG